MTARLLDGRLRELAALVVDDVLAQPAAEVVEPAVVAEQFVAVLVAPAARALVARHVALVIQTERERIDAKETLGAFVPEDVKAAVSSRLARRLELPEGWGRDVLSPELIRAVLADALAGVLEDFLGSLPMAARAGSLLGSLTRRAGRASTAGIPFASQARIFAAARADNLADRIQEQMFHPRNMSELNATIERAVMAVLQLSVQRVIGWADDPGVDGVADWVGATLAHNVARDEIRAAVQTEVTAAMAQHPEPLSALLQRLGRLTEARAALIETASRNLSRVVATGDFAVWLTATLQEAMD